MQNTVTAISIATAVPIKSFCGGKGQSITANTNNTLVPIKAPKPAVQQPLHRARTLTIVAVSVLLILATGWTIVGASVRRPKRHVSDSSTLESPDFTWSNDDNKLPD